jgi:hypothetical protein
LLLLVPQTDGMGYANSSNALHTSPHCHPEAGECLSEQITDALTASTYDIMLNLSFSLSRILVASVCCFLVRIETLRHGKTGKRISNLNLARVLLRRVSLEMRQYVERLNVSYDQGLTSKLKSQLFVSL